MHGDELNIMNASCTCACVCVSFDKKNLRKPEHAYCNEVGRSVMTTARVFRGLQLFF